MASQSFRRRRWPPWVWVGIAGVPLGAVAVWSAFVLSADRWGAVGEWLGAVATVAAVWTALHIARREARAAEVRAQSEAHEREARALRDAYDREVRQASLVLCEALYFNEYDWSPDWRDQYGPHFPDLEVKITNHSPEPILLPRLECFVHPGGGNARWSLWEDPTGMDEGWRPKESLAPGADSKIMVKVAYDPPLSDEQQRLMWDAIPVIGFTDASGRGWRRRGNQPPIMVHPGDVAEMDGPEWYQVRRS